MIAKEAAKEKFIRELKEELKEEIIDELRKRSREYVQKKSKENRGIE